MKSLLYIAPLLSTAILVACSVSSLQPTKQQSKATNVPLAKLQEGYGLYTRQCHQCHYQPDPKAITPKQWSQIVPNMAEHAGISKEDGDAVLAYLLSQRE